MAQFEKHFVQDLTQDIKIRQCGTIVFNGDNLSNVITVDLYNGTEPYSGGGSVSCSVICPDGATVPITNGSISGNTVTVTLTGDCFALPGQIGVGVQVVNGDIRTTVLKAIYNVELLETDTIVDPGSRITASVGQLVSDIENAVAQIPASDMASLMAGIAPTFSASTNYTAGAYVYHNGTLYRFTANHAAGSWTGTDATAVALGNDLGGQISDIKSTFTDGYYANSGYLQGYRNSSFNVISHASRCTTASVFHLVPGDTLVVENVPSTLKFVYQGISNGQYVVNSGWISTDSKLDIVAEGEYFLNIGKVGDGNMSPADVTFTVRAIPKTNFASKTDVNYLIDSLETAKAFYVDTESYGTAGAPYSPTTIISAGAKTIGIDVYCVTAGTLKIGLWDISNNTYYGEQSFTVSAGLNTLEYRETVVSASRIVFNATNLVRYVVNAAGFGITPVTVSNDSVTAGATLANYGIYATIYYFQGTSAETNTLRVGSGQEYATINDALAKAYTIESINNPITIIVYPGVYDEVLNINGKHYVSIIGINRDDCIIRNGSADYNKAPLRISGQAYIANLTLIETAEDYVSTHGSGTGSAAWKTDTLAGYAIYDWLGTNMAYAVHCDDVTNGEKTVCRFENCKIYCECGPAFGSGMQINQSIELVNCEIETNIDADVYNYCATTTGKGAIAQGTLLCHGKENGQDMRLLVKDCVVTANVGRVLYMYPVGTNNDATAEFINNSFFSNSLGSATEYYKITFNVADLLSGISHGNNISLLNKGVFAE